MSPAAAAAGEGQRWRSPIESTQDCRDPARACSGPEGMALLVLALLGLVLYLAPARPLVAWLAVGATTAWWGLSREPRRPRALQLLASRSSRRQRTLLLSPSAKSAVKRNLQEPRTLLERLNPTELLLMGCYLGKPGPPQLATAQEGRDLLERPARSSPPAPAAQRIQREHGYPSLPTPFHRPSRRPAHRDCGTLSNPFIIAPRRYYPIQQSQYSLLGVLPTVCWNGCQKKAVLSARNSKMVCSPATVRIAPPDSKLTRCPIPERLINSSLPSPSSNVPDPCAKEAVLNALKEGKKRTLEKEDQVFVDGQENKRSRHDSRSGHSPFVPLVANGVPASFVPNPGSLKRGLTSQSSEDHLSKRARTSSVSSLTSTRAGGIRSSNRNAITSSYSSTRGISRQQLWKRSGSISSPFSSPASSRSETPERPAKKTRKEEPCQHSSSSTRTPLVSNRESQGERVADTPKQQNSGASPSTPGSSRQRKRKIPLLPSRRRDQLTLPSPPQLGYSITAEDFDLEKKASLQWLNKVLEDKTVVPPNSENPPTTEPSFTFTLPVVGATSSAASWPDTGTSPSLESLKKTQSLPGPSLPESSPLKTPDLQASLGSLPPGPLPGTSSDSKSTTTSVELVPASSTAPVTDTELPSAPQADTSTKAPGPLTPSPTPMQGVLFGMSGSETSDPSSPAAPAMSSASPTFKPIFVMASNSKSEGSLPSNLSTTASTFPTMTSTATSTFKSIFGDLRPPVAVPLPAPFSCKPTTTVTAAAAPAAPLFADLASATSAVAPTTTTSVSTDSASQHAFCFGVNSVASTGSSTTSSMISASLPFPFGGAPGSAASFSRAMGSEFQFGKPLTMQKSTVATTFGQSLPGAVQTATSKSSSSNSSSSSSSTAGFSGFSTSLTTSAPATTCQPTLTFSNRITPAFNIPFGSSANHSLPAYSAAISQPKFGAANGQQQGSTRKTPTPNLGSPFTSGNSGAPAPSAALAPAPAQPASGNSGQSVFGLKTIASAFRAPASTLKAFGAATTSGFRGITQTTINGPSSSVFGNSTRSPFMFGGSAAPAVSGGFGLGVAAPDTSSTSRAFGCGAGQSGTTGTTTPIRGDLNQNALGTLFAFNMAGTSEIKPVFGGTSTTTFGKNTPTTRMGTAGSSLSFGVSSTPTQGFIGVGSFGSAAPSFSIGSGTKTPGARPRLQARRQHTRKK